MKIEVEIRDNSIVTGRERGKETSRPRGMVKWQTYVTVSVRRREALIEAEGLAKARWPGMTSYKGKIIQ